MPDRVVGRSLPFGRQFNMSGSMQGQQESPANHVARLAVGLKPPPGFTHFDREPTPAQARVLHNELPQKSDVGGTNLTTAKTQQHFGHGPKFSGRTVER